MSDALLSALEDLLCVSFVMWGIVAEVRVVSGDEPVSSKLTVQVSEAEPIVIARASSDLPFRWVVRVDGRTRTASSVGGVLRIVRQALDPNYQPVAIRIGPLSQPRPPS